jgi:hypothetical protein
MGADVSGSDEEATLPDVGALMKSSQITRKLEAARARRQSILAERGTADPLPPRLPWETEEYRALSEAPEPEAEVGPFEAAVSIGVEMAEPRVEAPPPEAEAARPEMVEPEGAEAGISPLAAPPSEAGAAFPDTAEPVVPEAAERTMALPPSEEAVLPSETAEPIGMEVADPVMGKPSLEEEGTPSRTTEPTGGEAAAVAMAVTTSEAAPPETSDPIVAEVAAPVMAAPEPDIRLAAAPAKSRIAAVVSASRATARQVASRLFEWVSASRVALRAFAARGAVGVSATGAAVGLRAARLVARIRSAGAISGMQSSRLAGPAVVAVLLLGMFAVAIERRFDLWPRSAGAPPVVFGATVPPVLELPAASRAAPGVADRGELQPVGSPGNATAPLLRGTAVPVAVPAALGLPQALDPRPLFFGPEVGPLPRPEVPEYAPPDLVAGNLRAVSVQAVVALPSASPVAPPRPAPGQEARLVPRLAAVPFAPEPSAALAGAWTGPVPRLLVFLPDRRAEGLEQVEAALGVLGLQPAAMGEVGFTVRQTHVRFYHADDRDGAARLADAVGVEMRDFTESRPLPPAGTLEVWVSGVARARPPAEPARPMLLHEYVARFLGIGRAGASADR